MSSPYVFWVDLIRHPNIDEAITDHNILVLYFYGPKNEKMEFLCSSLGFDCRDSRVEKQFESPAQLREVAKIIRTGYEKVKGTTNKFFFGFSAYKYLSSWDEALEKVLMTHRTHDPDFEFDAELFDGFVDYSVYFPECIEEGKKVEKYLEKYLELSGTKVLEQAMAEPFPTKFKIFFVLSEYVIPEERGIEYLKSLPREELHLYHLWYACQCGRPKIAEYLIERGIVPHTQELQRIIEKACEPHDDGETYEKLMGRMREKSKEIIKNTVVLGLFE